MSITPMMTTGQMKQVIRRLDGSVPADLTHQEANLFAQSAQVGRELEVFWFQVRNIPKKRMAIFPVYVDGMVMEAIDNYHIELAGARSDGVNELKSLATKFPTANPRLEALEICEISGEFDSVDAIKAVLSRQGYVSAGFDDLIAFVTQHSDYFARIGPAAYVHVLSETDNGRFPLIWSDTSTGGYAHFQLAFDDWEDGVSDQVSSSSISALVKKM